MCKIKIETKICLKCNVEQPISEFYFRRFNKKGEKVYQTPCKTCSSIRYREQVKPLKIVKCKVCLIEFLQTRSDQVHCGEYCRDRVKSFKNPVKGYKKFKKTYCEDCGFVAVDKCQLDVDHIDGNHNNNDLSNLQTLCANCHRLKTKLSKDGVYKEDNRRNNVKYREISKEEIQLILKDS